MRFNPDQRTDVAVKIVNDLLKSIETSVSMLPESDVHFKTTVSFIHGLLELLITKYWHREDIPNIQRFIGLETLYSNLYYDHKKKEVKRTDENLG